MRRLIFHLLLLFAASPLTAQIRGKLIDVTGAPVAFATVVLLAEPDSTMAGGAMSAENGEYVIENVKPGMYRLQLTSVGYRTWISPVLAFNKADGTLDEGVKQDLGVQLMTPDATQLDEVVVRAEKPLFEHRAEGIVINVENSVMTKGSTVLQLLERSPGIRIDRQNSTMELNGKNGVVVMINGKLIRMPVEQLITLLNGMSANEIVRLELLSTPPAGFDAEGSAGIINIIMRKSIDPGTTGSISLTGGYGYREKAMLSASINHIGERLNVHGSYSFSRDRSSAYFFATGHEQEPFLGGYASSDFLSRSNPVQNSHNASIAVDRNINTRTTVGGSVAYNNSKTSIPMINHGIYHVDPDSVYELNATANSINHWQSTMSNVFTVYQLGDGGKFSADADYLNFRNNYPTESLNSFLSVDGHQAGSNDTLFSPVSRGNSRTLIQVGTLKTDYANTFAAGWKLETGIKGTLTRTRGTSVIENFVEGEFVTRPASVNNLVMHEKIGAAYASLNVDVDSSVHVVIGLRYEYSDTQITNTESDAVVADRKLGKLFPSILVSRAINAKSGLDLSFTKRISRPSYNDLASFVTPNGPTSVNTGNPLLRPTVTNNLSLGYHHSGYALSVLASRDTHPIARNQIVYSKDKTQQAVSPQNLNYQNNLTFQTTIPVRATSWWDMSYGTVGGWRSFKLEYTAVPAKKTYFTYSLRASETFILPGSFAIEVSGLFNAEGYNGSRKTERFGLVNLGLKKEFRAGGVLQLTLNDVFRTGVYRSYFGKLTQEAFNLETHVAYHPESNLYHTIRLTYTKSFGSKKVTGGRRLNESSQSERERIGN